MADIIKSTTRRQAKKNFLRSLGISLSSNLHPHPKFKVITVEENLTKHMQMQIVAFIIKMQLQRRKCLLT